MEFPVILEKDEDGFYFVRCPLFEGCFTQGENINDALLNIKEVIEMFLEEKEQKLIAQKYQSGLIQLRYVTV